MTTVIPNQFHDLRQAPGFRHLELDTVSSTNTLALDHARNGDPGQLWITAVRQEAGKARRGRSWVSEPGNLYATLLLVDVAPDAALATLPLVASLALHKAIVSECPGFNQRLKIKWPNDLLLDGKKLSGILLEAARDTTGRQVVAVGWGVNCAHFPPDPLYPATSIADGGGELGPKDLFVKLAQTMAAQLKVWSAGQGFSAIRQQWLEHATGIGEKITVHFSDAETSGLFKDIDEQGMLLLETDTGAVETISAADIFFGNFGTRGA